MSAVQLRSLLYVPAIRPEWVDKTRRVEPDAVILDLEDAVPAARKAEAAKLARRSIADHGAEIRLMVRINPVSTRYWLDDLEQVVVQGLFGVVIPKCDSPSEVATVAAVLARLEERAGMEPGSVHLAPMFESPQGLHQAVAVLSTSERVAYSWAGHTLDGDLGRELRWGWTPQGQESYFVRSKVILDSAAAGVRFPISGLWASIDDLEGLRQFAEQNLLLGYTGMQVIHPSHVPVVNEVFTPGTEEIERLERIVCSMRDAQADGDGAIPLDGVMVDEAMAAHASRRLAEIAALGIPVNTETLNEVKE